jgi:hypothetical protein
MLVFLWVDRVDLGFERLMWAFGKPLTTLGILLAMEFLALFILYPSYYFWSTTRLQYKPGRDAKLMGSTLSYVLYTLYGSGGNSYRVSWGFVV